MSPTDGRLRPAALIEAAQDETGLDGWDHPDQPDGYWRDGLDVIVDALERQARLSETGRLAMQARLDGYLRNRLRVNDWLRAHPESAADAGAELDAPAVITGLPRTGTTALSNLLAQDPGTRSLRVWESASPLPPPEAATEHDDPRIAATQAGLDLFEQMVPAMKAMHHDTATSTAEALDLLGMSLRTHHFGGMAEVPSYDEWWLTCEMGPAYRYHRHVLALLQSRCPPTRWHLKNPPDLFCLGAVRTAYPRARFLWTHREPADVLPSVASLIATVQTLATDDVDPVAVGTHHAELWATAVERGMAWRDAHPEGFVDVYMQDLVDDPLGTVAMIYAGLGWELTAEAEAAMEAWLGANPPGRHGEHSPDPAEFGLDPDELTERFTSYRERFLEGR